MGVNYPHHVGINWPGDEGSYNWNEGLFYSWNESFGLCILACSNAGTRSSSLAVWHCNDAGTRALSLAFWCLTVENAGFEFCKTRALNSSSYLSVKLRCGLRASRFDTAMTLRCGLQALHLGIAVKLGTRASSPAFWLARVALISLAFGV